MEEGDEAELMQVWPPGVDLWRVWAGGDGVFANTKESRLVDLHLSPFKRGTKDRSEKELNMCQNASDSKMSQRVNERNPT